MEQHENKRTIFYLFFLLIWSLFCNNFLCIFRFFFSPGRIDLGKDNSQGLKKETKSILSDLAGSGAAKITGRGCIENPGDNSKLETLKGREHL